MINFGIRQSFEIIEQIEERFCEIKVPIEIALPYYWDIYEPVRSHLKEIADTIKSFQLEILSIHAVQAPITNDKFKVWGREIADFAKMLDVNVVVVHPNNTNRKLGMQEKALENLKYFIALYKDTIIFAIETFLGKRRVFTPQEIVQFNLPMTLDVAHIKDNEMIWDLLRDYRDSIINVHLSAKRDKVHHLPIDPFCNDVVDYLIKDNWNGNIILEYLPEFHSQLLTDLKSLNKRR